VVRDETVEIARSLYAAQHYDTIVCNYTHMARVAKELEAVRPLPSVAIVTHDALSRLPREFRGSKLDTSYRATTAAMERAALDAVPGAVVVAISESEASYFGEIGTANPVVLCEYDAAEEMAPFAVPPDSFGRRSIIFHGSANPMNIAGLDWFVDECWAEIQAAVPDARLVVCGRVGEKWNPGLPGIEVVGEQPREAMLALCSAASMTINPCVAGTGLKIKTVEAACLGLPAVCLPLAVEGLEAVAPRFAMVERDAEGFAAACIRLMTDEPHWQALHEGALAVAGERFSANAVYGALDAAMGWTPAAVPEQALPGAGLAAGPDLALPVGAAATGPGGAPDDALLLALGRRMIDGGQGALGWGMVASVADRHAGDPGVAAEAARAAAAVGEDWLALQHAVVVIGQRPAEAEGYRLGGQALLRLGLLPDAIACLQQGALVAPGDEAMLRLLCEALSAAGREEEAARWATLRALELVPGRYVALDAASVGPGAARGWQVGADGALVLPAGGNASMRFALPEAATKQTLNIDVGVQSTSPLQLQVLVGNDMAVYKFDAGRSVHAISLELTHFPQWERGSQTVTIRAMDSAGDGKVSLIGLELI
jgi:glycosyltransferase involved in cell wall biosynthesis